jgi:DnaJ family protein A protein 2
MIQFIPTTAF